MKKVVSKKEKRPFARRKTYRDPEWINWWGSQRWKEIIEMNDPSGLT